MDPRLTLVVLIAQIILGAANANILFNVQHKFGGRGGGRNSTSTADGRSTLGTLRSHDDQRHGRMLAAVDFMLGGNGLPTGSGLYYTKLSIGTPPKDYFVQVDTGSDNLWLNCAGCDTCPTKTDLGFKLKPYDLQASSTGKTIACDEDFCSAAVKDADFDCKVGSQCGFSVAYGDGSKTAGFYVRDNFQFDKISGDLQTASMDGGTIAFGCSTKQAGGSSSSSTAVDGIVGFGQGNTSVLSQLASSGKTKRIFSHCLDSVAGGGIFALGEVVEPKVQTTPMVPKMVHYNAYLVSIEVGGSAVWKPTEVPMDNLLNTTSKGTDAIIDSGTTLAYLPDEIHDSIMSNIMAKQQELETYLVDSDYTCMKYHHNIDDNFPVVSFHFQNSAVLNTYPHDYLFSTMPNEYCFGWMKKAHMVDGKQVTLLGDIVLADKLIVYDLENMTIGWTEYNCSSSIKVKDEISGDMYKVVSHDISPTSSAHTLCNANVLTLFVSILMMWYFLE